MYLYQLFIESLKKTDLSLDNGFYINYMRRALNSFSTFYEH